VAAIAIELVRRNGSVLHIDASAHFLHIYHDGSITPRVNPRLPK
jgi:hypothetical protein